MTRLVLAELRAGVTTWIGVVLVAAVFALAAGIGLSMAETGLHAGEPYVSGFSGGTAVVLMFSVPSGLAVVAAIARLAVDLGRPGYARWQLAGGGPAQTAGIVLAQLAVAGLLGGLVGLGATLLLAESAVHAAFDEGSGGYTEIPIVTGPLTAGIVVPLTVAVALAGGVRAARSAASGSPLAALREPETRAKRMRWWRWALLALVTAGAAAGIAAVLGASDRSTFLSSGPLVPVYLTLPLLAAGPLLYPLALRAWTALIPARTSSSWYLARHQARYHLGRSTASITPLFAGTALVGGLFTMSATVDVSLRAAGSPGVSLGIAQVLLIAGGPVLLAAVGAAVVVFMSNRTQGNEQSLLRASGGAPGVVLAAAIWQALIHVVTALLLAGLVIVATALVCATALARFGAGIPVLDLAPALVLGGVGLVLSLLATALPVLARLREPVAARLAAV